MSSKTHIYHCNEWLHTPAQPKEWCFEFNRTLYPPDYQDDRQHTPRFLWGFSRPPKLCPCKFFWGERLPSLGHEEGHLWGLQESPEPFPSRETPDKHLGPPKCLPDGN